MKWHISLLTKLKTIIPYGLFFVTFVVTHFFGLTRTVAADEPLYVRQAGKFYYALTHQDFTETDRIAAPGVPALWAGTLSYLVEFPTFASVGGLDIPDLTTKQLIEKSGTSELALIRTARMGMVLLNASLLAFSFFFLAKLLPKPAILLGMGAVLLDPFLFDHLRILGSDGSLSTSMLLSVASYLVHLEEKKRGALLVSGCAAGLAFLSKTTALGLLPLMGLIEVLHAAQQPQPRLAAFFKRPLNWLIWAGTLLGTTFVLWPALWVDPLTPLSALYSFMFNAGAGAENLSSATFFNGEIYPAGAMNAPFFYLIAGLWRTTPLVWGGLILTMIFWRKSTPQTRQTLRYLIVYTVGFAVLLSFSGKKFDRYILVSFLGLLVISGIGWEALFSTLQNQWHKAMLVAGLLVGQLLLLAPVQPYFLSYYNPIMRLFQEPEEVMVIGWGEGLDQAANFLNQQPDIYQQTVHSWYPSVFDFHFYGHPTNPKPVPYYYQPGEERFDNVLLGDYVVLYLHQWQRDIPAELLRIYETQTPVYTVEINGIEYVRVYKNDH